MRQKSPHIGGIHRSVVSDRSAGDRGVYAPRARSTHPFGQCISSVHGCHLYLARYDVDKVHKCAKNHPILAVFTVRSSVATDRQVTEVYMLHALARHTHLANVLAWYMAISYT